MQHILLDIVLCDGEMKDVERTFSGSGIEEEENAICSLVEATKIIGAKKKQIILSLGAKKKRFLRTL